MSLPAKQSRRTDQWGNPILPADYHGFSRIMCNEYLCDMVLENMDNPPTLWSLLNISRSIRACLLTYHFHRYRRIIVMRIFMPSHWVMPHPTNWTLRDEKYRRRMIDSGRWPKNKKYFARFTDFNFEELVIGKVLRIPYWVAPTMDTGYVEKMTGLGLYLTTLILDGTAVTGRGLFGSVAQPLSNDVYRTSPGLISYIAHHLEHLSIKNCPNIQHSDIAIYLLLPPSDNCQLSKLTTLRCFNCGEAPTDGPFHNLPGYGSKNLVVQKSDNILNIQILGLLFTRLIPLRHHWSVSLQLSLPAFDLDGAAKRQAKIRFENLFKAGWFNAKTLTRFPPPVELPLPESDILIPGPFGGFIAAMNESLMLKSISFFRNIKLDWCLCCMGASCVTFAQKSFTPAARINSRTGRTVQLGNLYGAVTGGKIRRKEYFHVVDGIRPRVPVALTTLLPGKYKTHLPIDEENFPERTSHFPARPECSHAPNDPPKEGHPDEIKKYRPRFASLAGMVPGPDYEDPDGEGDKTFTVTGLSGEGLHTHSSTGTAARREKGGKVCVNCGLWEYENYVWTYEEPDSEDEEMEDEPNEEEQEEEEEKEQKPRKTKPVKVKDPGRQIIGELCEVCVPFFTCGDCGDFYCPSCLIAPREGDRPNPWASSPPHPDLMRHPCDIHGGEQFLKDHNVVMRKDEYSCFTCQTCFEYQLAWAKTEQDRVEVWKYVGVNILQREMTEVKAKELEYGIDADIQQRRKESIWGSYSAPKKKKRRPKVGEEMPITIEQKKDPDSSDFESDNSDEASSTSSGYSSSSTQPEKSGKNHPIIKAIDALYPLLGNLVGRSTSTPHGTAELMKAMRLARKNILARKLAEQSYRLKRQNMKQARKRVKNAEDPAINDPILRDSQSDHMRGINTHIIPAGQQTATPLRNVADEISDGNVKEGFDWVPSDMDRIYWESKVNDINSDYYLTGPDLTRMDFEIEEEEKNERKRKRSWARHGTKGVDWRLGYLPDDWSGERSKANKREKEESSSDEDNIMIVTKDGRKKVTSLKILRLAIKKLKLSGKDKKIDQKSVKFVKIVPEGKKRQFKTPGKLWVAKEAERKQEEEEEEAKKRAGLRGIARRKILKKAARAEKKRKLKEKKASTTEDVTTGEVTEMMRDLNVATEAGTVEPAERIRGRRVRFAEVVGQAPPGVTRRAPAVLDGREREIYQEETKEDSERD
ncbi:hypothetical protein AOL_s00007g97 [Orbilia oligospora ATCC 24927]|uniref:Uncharacterized protein n=1 Tax=Arthrobotrys oligospora (strain ATCC 24927 / CBS 115.81 / DSM 1491) TaxID=756982 RepID=G1X1D8_ARTOA|nr:hypothetical protein AOL_s00007g97 [Orbilia oligospora ATCC 24927]EGX52761.1 hypothetical protein AOL_s00007g97 [Orbilia oligospora ATCC 24927]